MVRWPVCFGTAIEEGEWQVEEITAKRIEQAQWKQIVEHNLGRFIYSGEAEPNTGIPGDIAGYTRERVEYSTKAGIFKAICKIGETVYPGDQLG